METARQYAVCCGISFDSGRSAALKHYLKHVKNCRSIAIRVSVCLSVRSYISKTTYTSRNFSYVLPVSVRGSAIPWRHCSKLCIPVLLSTSCFHITPNVQSDDADIRKRVNACARETKSAFLDCFVSQYTPEN